MNIQPRIMYIRSWGPIRMETGHLGWWGKYDAESTTDDLVEDKGMNARRPCFLAGGQIWCFIPKHKVRYLGILLNRHVAYIVAE